MSKSIFFLVITIIFISCLKPSDSRHKVVLKKDFKTVKNLLNRFLEHPDSAAIITNSMLPNEQDLIKIFDTSLQSAALNYINTLKKERFIIKPRPRQTGLFIESVTTEDLQTNNIKSLAFPSAYSSIAPFLQPDLTIYRFKFVIDNNVAGSAYDGLVFVNKKWVIVPKMYKIISE